MKLLAAFCALALVTLADGHARADDDPAGTYQVEFEQVTNNCTDVSLDMRKGAVSLKTSQGNRLQLVVPRTPLLRGSFSKGGKFKARAPKGPTSISGVDGKFSGAGRADGKTLQMVFVAEFYRGNKPICTQSWNVTGKR